MSKVTFDIMDINLDPEALEAAVRVWWQQCQYENLEIGLVCMDWDYEIKASPGLELEMKQRMAYALKAYIALVDEKKAKITVKEYEGAGEE